MEENLTDFNTLDDIAIPYGPINAGERYLPQGQEWAAELMYQML
jgi:hypothetical protein